MRVVRPGIAPVILALAGVVVGARAEVPAVLQADVHAHDGWLHVTARLGDLIDDRTASTIESGLSGVCAYEVSLLGPGDEVVGRRVWTRRLTYDLWEDRYTVSGPERDAVVPGLAAMDSLCSTIDDLRLAPMDRLQPDTEYRLAIVVEVLPLGAEARDRLSRYISRRGDTGRRDVDVDLGSLFGGLFTGGDAGRSSLVHVGRPFRPRSLELRP
ncbi:hypothetical protein GF314_05090 [bacterium]|nr:hypothetical protein [bacterium]